MKQGGVSRKEPESAGRFVDDLCSTKRHHSRSRIKALAVKRLQIAGTELDTLTSLLAWPPTTGPLPPSHPDPCQGRAVWRSGRYPAGLPVPSALPAAERAQLTESLRGDPGQRYCGGTAHSAPR
ncbi:hypothetical protein AAFF_G00072650 [Aldrovandia affinis]|uniref:Uncharacterized protein n=1 Tax=Aldrovandia affinis TaxID=143900 RepID=A0AAD7S176_9TELE|nr:hypothetical protein AAFF_G00072650 [Aldrovandia affinis]